MKCAKCKGYKGKTVPRNGCATCWAKYFYNHVGTSALLLKLIDTKPDDAISAYGTEMVKQFKSFIKERNDRNGTTDNTSGA